MPWLIDLNPETKVVVTLYSGVVSPPELAEAVQETIRVGVDHETGLFLADCTDLKGGHSVFDLYEVMKRVLSAGAERPFKEAVLLPSAAFPAEGARFWETLCLNRGLQVQVFQDRETALAWLLQG